MNLEEAFIAAGIPAPPARAKTLPSSFIRWGKNNRYWTKLFDGGAIFGDYSTGESHNWFEDDDKLLDAEQIAKRKEKLAALKKEQQEEQARIYEEASVIALNQWNGLVSEGVSPYLQRKQIEAFNIRFDDDKIVIPVLN